MIQTVLGPLDELSGPILAHEHLQIDLCCQKGPQVLLNDADQDDVCHDLSKAMAHGLKAVADLSVLGSGRNPEGLRRISQKLGLPVVCAAGFYWDPYPDIVLRSSVEELRDILVREVLVGIEETGVRAGVIKIGTSREEIGAPAQRVFQAAALAARATGASVITHTSAIEQAYWHLSELQGSGLDASRILISHMGCARDALELQKIGRSGAFLGIDKVGYIARRANDELADLVRDACELGLSQQIILSSDVARKDRLLRRGGSSYGAVFTDFLPMLRQRGVTEQCIEQMLCGNPLRVIGGMAKASQGASDSR